MNISRREFLSSASKYAAWATLPSLGFLSACAKNNSENKPEMELDIKSGTLVAVEDILNNKIETEYYKKIDEIKEKYKTVLVVSKKYRIHWLFKDGALINRGPAGTASINNGYTTPSKEYSVGRKEGIGYTSNQYPGAKMDYATFIDDAGRAFHGSGNYVWRYDTKKGRKVIKLLVDNSHGCINALDEDAKLANETLKQGDKVVVLD